MYHSGRTRPSFLSQNGERKSKNPFEICLGRFLAKPEEAIELELSRMIDDPALVLGCELIAGGHWLHEGFLTIMDALDALSNGMENPKAQLELEGLPNRPIFTPWKKALSGLQFFYLGDDQRAHETWSSIDPQHPAARLRNIIDHLQDPSASEKGLKKLLDKILEPDIPLTDSFQQMYDALDAGVEEVFFINLARGLNLLAKHSMELSTALAQWAMGQVMHHDWDEEGLVRTLSNHFGKTESCRLIAIGLMEEDPESALLFWLQFLIYGLREEHFNEAKFRAALSIFASVEEGVHHLWKENPPDPEYLRQKPALEHQLEKEMEIRGFLQLLESKSQSIEFPSSDQEIKQIPHPKGPSSPKKTSDGIQLDLFAS